MFQSFDHLEISLAPKLGERSLVSPIPDFHLFLARKHMALVKLAMTGATAGCEEVIVRLNARALPMPRLVAVARFTPTALAHAIDLQRAVNAICQIKQRAVAIVHSNASQQMTFSFRFGSCEVR